MGDYIVIAVLCCIVAGIIYKMVKDKKSGKSACGCDCSKCGKGCKSHMEP